MTKDASNQKADTADQGSNEATEQAAESLRSGNEVNVSAADRYRNSGEGSTVTSATTGEPLDAATGEPKGSRLQEQSGASDMGGGDTANDPEASAKPNE